MTESNVVPNTSERKEVYKGLLKEIITNSFSVFLILIVCKLVSKAIYFFHEKESVFDSALKALLHYGKDSMSILFLTTSSLILLLITLILEPGYLAVGFRKYISIPALNISGHMLSMVAGATLGWYLLVAVNNPFDLRVLGQVLFICFLCILFSFLSQSAKLFFDHEFVKLKGQDTKIITIFTIVFGAISTGVMYVTYIYNFTSTVGH